MGCEMFDLLPLFRTVLNMKIDGNSILVLSGDGVNFNFRTQEYVK